MQRIGFLHTSLRRGKVFQAKKKSDDDSDPPVKKPIKRSKLVSSSSPSPKSEPKLSKTKATLNIPTTEDVFPDIDKGDDSIDSEEIDMDVLRSLLAKVTATKAMLPPPGVATPLIPSKAKMASPKRGRPSTKLIVPELDSEQSDVSNIISEEELQEALREMESSEDFNFNLDMDDFLDEDAQIDLESDLDVPDSENFLRAVSSEDPLVGLRVPKADKLGVSTKIDGKVGIDDLDDDELDTEEEEELPDEDDDYLAALDRRRDLLGDDEDLLLDDVIGSKQLAALEVDEEEEDEVRKPMLLFIVPILNLLLNQDEDEDDVDVDDEASTEWSKKRRPTKLSKPEPGSGRKSFNDEKGSAKGKRAAEPDALIVDGVELKGEVGSCFSLNQSVQSPLTQ